MKLKLMVAAACLAASFSAAAQTPIVIKFSHILAPDSAKGAAAEHFKMLAEKMTKGRVKVEVYPQGKLYKDGEELKALQDGNVQMLAPSLARFGPFGVKEFEVFDLPYIFPNKVALNKVTEGEVGKILLKKLEAKGVVGLAFWDNGFKVMSANKPLYAPADFIGLKVRINSSAIIDAQMRALGAVPKVISYADTYRSLKTGVVDGAENPPSNLVGEKMHEVQKYLTQSNHGYLGYAVIANKRFWDGLPADIRNQLERAIAETSELEKALAQRANDQAIEAVRKSGKTEIYTLSTEEQAAWRKALVPVQVKMEARIDKEIMTAVHQATGNFLVH